MPPKVGKPQKCSACGGIGHKKFSPRCPGLPRLQIHVRPISSVTVVYSSQPNVPAAGYNDRTLRSRRNSSQAPNRPVAPHSASAAGLRQEAAAARVADDERRASERVLLHQLHQDDISESLFNSDSSQREEFFIPLESTNDGILDTADLGESGEAALRNDAQNNDPTKHLDGWDDFRAVEDDPLFTDMDEKHAEMLKKYMEKLYRKIYDTIKVRDSPGERRKNALSLMSNSDIFWIKPDHVFTEREISSLQILPYCLRSVLFWNPEDIFLEELPDGVLPCPKCKKADKSRISHQGLNPKVRTLGVTISLKILIITYRGHV